MTTNQTIDGVPRATLANFIEYSVPVSQDDQWYRDKQELRALLDAPVCKACNDTKKMHEPGQDPGSCTACLEKPAAQPQGEPVAFIQIPKNVEKYGHGKDPDRLKFGKPGQFFVDGKSPMFDFVLLYAEQPAPVAVVLPEQLITAIETEQDRLSKEDYLMDSEDCVKVIREEVTRLNTK